MTRDVVIVEDRGVVSSVWGSIVGAGKSTGVYILA